MNVAVIPARGGSQRIPRKNIREFCGRPIMAYSVDAALKCDLFDRVIVSTEDDEIASVAETLGAEVPFERPSELADEFAGTVDVIAHAARWMIDANWSVQKICCIYATAPLLSPEDLKLGLELLEAGDWSYVLSACEYPSTIFRSFRALPGGGIEMFFPQMYDERSQDLPEALHDAGQFYWGEVGSWIARTPLFTALTRALVIPRTRVIDIDTEDDWRQAERMHRSR